FFFQAEDGIRDFHVTGVKTCALPISAEYVPKKPIPHPLQKRTISSRKKNSNSSPSSNSPQLQKTITNSKKKNNKDSSQSIRLPKDRKSVVLGKECRNRSSSYHVKRHV